MYRVVVLLLGFCLYYGVAGAAQTHQHDQPTPQSTSENPEVNGKPVKLVGYVRDAFCLMKNPQAGAATDAESRSCMRKCIQAGSPLVILGEDGTVYLPIAAGDAPDKNERNRLLPHAGQMVRITGWTFERGNMHSIAIRQIEVISH